MSTINEARLISRVKPLMGAVVMGLDFVKGSPQLSVTDARETQLLIYKETGWEISDPMDADLVEDAAAIKALPVDLLINPNWTIRDVATNSVGGQALLASDGRAVIVGQSTYGAPSVQPVKIFNVASPLSKVASVKMTYDESGIPQAYWAVEDSHAQGKGVGITVYALSDPLKNKSAAETYTIKNSVLPGSFQSVIDGQGNMRSVWIGATSLKPWSVGTSRPGAWEVLEQAISDQPVSKVSVAVNKYKDAIAIYTDAQTGILGGATRLADEPGWSKIAFPANYSAEDFVASLGDDRNVTIVLRKGSELQSITGSI